jgi:hypothetical protein
VAASNALLEQLHEIVGKELLARIETGEAKASDFAQAIKFLSDNGIEAVATADNALSQIEGALKDRLPFTNEDTHLSH